MNNLQFPSRAPGGLWILRVLWMAGMCLFLLPAAADPATPAAATRSPDSPEVRLNYFTVDLGGGGWRYSSPVATLQGTQGRLGVTWIQLRDRLRLSAGLQARIIRQSVEDISQQTQIGPVEGSGYRKSLAANGVGGLGYQWTGTRTRPYLMGQIGIAGGLDATRIDVGLYTDTTQTPLGTLYGYEIDQTIGFKAPFYSPSLGLEVGLEPLLKGRYPIGFAVDVSYWPMNRTVSLGLVLRSGWPIAEKSSSSRKQRARPS